MTELEAGSFQDDFSRADLMTPFSLSLAAERAIASAKLKLDEMDSRLLKARTSIRSAQRQSLSSIMPGRTDSQFVRGVGGRLTRDRGGLLNGEVNFVTRRRGQSMDHVTRENPELRVLEMKKLRDDLRDLRSRMSQTRAISETLNLTPPRCRRSQSSEPPTSPSSERGARKVETTVLDNFPAPPNIDRRSLDQLTTNQVQSTRQRGFESINHDGMKVEDLDVREKGQVDEDDDDIPVIATENPFSPRPYSSQSILTPLASDPYEGFSTPEDLSTPRQGSSATFEPSARPAFASPRPSARVIQRDAMSRISFITANESFMSARDTHSSSTQRLSSSSADYSDADTSPGTQSPITSKPAERSISAIPAGRSWDSLRPGSSMSNFSYGSLTGLAQIGNDEQRKLLGRVESALARITLTEASVDQDRRRQRRIEAALAILEDSSED